MGAPGTAARRGGTWEKIMGLIDLMKILNDPDMDQKIGALVEKLDYYVTILELIAERLDIPQTEIEERIDLKRKVRENAEMQEV